MKPEIQRHKCLQILLHRRPISSWLGFWRQAAQHLQMLGTFGVTLVMAMLHRCCTMRRTEVAWATSLRKDIGLGRMPLCCTDMLQRSSLQIVLFSIFTIHSVNHRIFQAVPRILVVVWQVCFGMWRSCRESLPKCGNLTAVPQVQYFSKVEYIHLFFGLGPWLTL